MTTILNPKAQAWNNVGKLFWQLGRNNAKPNTRMVNRFLENIPRQDTCLIIGASTKSLIETAINQHLTVTVIDFSETMCRDLANAIHNKPKKQKKQHLSILLQDALATPHPALCQSQQFILSDRLINRFSPEETYLFFDNIKYFMQPHAELRLTIKMGLYAVDHALIQQGKVWGTLDQFYNEQEGWIDFSKAPDEMNACTLSHGEIPQDILVAWYRGRAKEARFNQEKIHTLFNHHGFHLLEEEELDEQTSTFFYRVTL